MPSKIEIISNAAVLLGASPVESEDQDTKAARVGFNLYPSTYLSALTMSHWGFAKAQQQLSLLVEEPLFDFQNAFQLPLTPKLLKIIKVISTTGGRTIRYQRYKDKIYTDHNTTFIEYLFDPTEAFLPPYFVTLMEFMMMDKMAMPVTADINYATLAKQNLQGAPELPTVTAE